MTGATVRSAQPVPDGMRAHIMRTLGEIEAREDVRVLFACESGSRGWGFASPDSDYDVRFIYVNRLPWYLTVAPRRDVIEVPISGDLDINGWDLRKALGLAGYESEAAFQRAFKQRRGMTPAQWRRRARAHAERGKPDT